MTDFGTSFSAGFDFEHMLRIISKQIYETPLAFIRENVQNAVDAVRIQALREGRQPRDESYRIEVSVTENKIVVRDNGIGMSPDDLKTFFWTIGASGKRTTEAKAAGCVGTFGIGGFANFGICEALTVISQTQDGEHGSQTRLTEADIREAGTALPQVSMTQSNKAAPRGTVVIGNLRKNINVESLRSYLSDFVKYVPTAVYFNDQKISQFRFTEIEDRKNYSSVGSGTSEWTEDEILITGRLYEDRGHTLSAEIENLVVGGDSYNMVGNIRFENGPVSVLKKGFKLCATQLPSAIGITGRLDCDRFVPTAGRDSLAAETNNLLSRIVAVLERVAIEAVLEKPQRIAQHTRIFRYLIRKGWVSKLGNVKVRLADGSEISLGEIRKKFDQSGISVYWGVTQKQALNQIMQARGHIVVHLSSDRYRRDAERQFLESFCKAKSFDGIVDCAQHYSELSRFEKVFLSELEFNITKSYEVEEFTLTVGSLTEDIPVFLREGHIGQPLEIFVDVRHPEIAKLEAVGYTSILYSLIATFCREYLGPSLKRWSPRFFGDGALNVELLSRRRSELWILVKNDIGEVHRGGKREVVTSSDIQMINVGGGQGEPEPSPKNPNPRLLRFVDDSGSTDLSGYYIRLRDSAFIAYGDLLQSCENLGLVWAGNKLTFVASDGVSAAFQYEIRLDELVIAGKNGQMRTEGARELSRPLQEIFDGIYFPIPNILESFLVPKGDQEIRLELFCDWIDMRTARQWLPKESPALEGHLETDRKLELDEDPSKYSS